MAKRKNVLFLFCDQLRADMIHALGNEEIVTPALDSLAKESTVFERCYTPSPVCVPARLSMMAGQYCARTGNCNNNKHNVYTGEGFYKRFTDAGYNTLCVGKMHKKPDTYASLGFRRRCTQEEMADPQDDYRNWLRTTPYNHVYDITGQRSELYYYPQVSQMPAEAHPTQWVGDRAADFLSAVDTGTEPFFLVASFIHPHPPFAPPAPWNKMYRSPVRKPFVPENRDDYKDLLRNKYTCDAFGMSERHLELLNQYYYACISFVDYQIGRLLRILKDRGLYDDTVILFSADHGELLGDYGSMGKRCMLDACAKIPFLLHLPGQMQEFRRDPASLVDFAPTLLSLCGIPYDKAEYDGIDLLHGSHELVYGQYANGNIGEYMVASDRDKLCYSAYGDRYYYFETAPDDKDTYDPQNPRCAYLKEKLNAYIASGKALDVADKPNFRCPLDAPYGSVYDSLDDHVKTIDEEAARMPEGYPVTLGGKKANNI